MSMSLLGASSLPWETLQHIYSRCDTCTLAVLCLVSFESWKMAGPVLYEHVDLRSVDGVKAFFFLADLPPTARLSPPVPLLRRVKTLKIELSKYCHQRSEPIIGFEQRQCAVSGAWVMEYDPPQLEPHRLRRSGFSPTLPVERLILATGPDAKHIQEFVFQHLLPLVNPRTVVHTRRRDERDQRNVFVCDRGTQPDLAFLTSWNNLERVIWSGVLASPYLTRGGLTDTALYSQWSTPSTTAPLPADPLITTRAVPRTLDIVFRFAHRLRDYTLWHQPPDKWSYVRPNALQRLLESGGVTEALAGRVELNVKLVVERKDERLAQADVEKLPTWMKKLVVVKAV